MAGGWARNCLCLTRNETRDANSEMLAEHDDLSFGEATIADIDVDRLTRESVQLHDGAAPEPQHFLHRHRGATQLDRHGKRQIEQHRERHLTAVCGRLRELVEAVIGWHLRGGWNRAGLHGGGHGHV